MGKERKDKFAEARDEINELIIKLVYKKDIPLGTVYGALSVTKDLLMTLLEAKAHDERLGIVTEEEDSSIDERMRNRSTYFGNNP